ncbi:MAG: hypothetical protein HYZ53_18365 [Planctomycetes bacterium]|nr:hypothetical protein [Planctomycetota bacterium]
MRALSNRLAFLAVAALLVASSGCLQLEQQWTVYPDGCGKVEIKQTVSLPPVPGSPPQVGTPQAGSDKDDAQLKEMLKETGGFEDYEGLSIDPATIKSEFKDGKLTSSCVGYFEDVTKVTQSGKAPLEWKKTPEGGFHCKLQMQDIGGFEGMKEGQGDESGDGGGGKAGAGGGAQDVRMQEAMKAAAKGFKAKITVRMPGALTGTGITKLDDRTFGVEIDDKIFDAKEREKFEKLDLSGWCGKPSDDLARELAAFKPELARALEAAAKAAAERDAAGVKKGSGGGAPAGGKRGAGGGEDAGEGKDDDESKGN